LFRSAGIEYVKEISDYTQKRSDSSSKSLHDMKPCLNFVLWGAGKLKNYKQGLNIIYIYTHIYTQIYMYLCTIQEMYFMVTSKDKRQVRKLQKIFKVITAMSQDRDNKFPNEAHYIRDIYIFLNES
jgi:hypothetical protein